MRKTIKTRTLRQGTMLRATPHEVYEMLMDSKKHAMFSGERARISRRVGGRIAAYSGWITGRNLKLTKDREIVQEWRGADWPKGHYSIVKFRLKRAGPNTKLMFSQTGIPESKYKEMRSGWGENYWEKMKAFLES